MKKAANFLAAFLAAAAAASAAQLDKATVTKVVNKVDIVTPAGAETPAALGEVLAGKNAVRTGSNSRAQLTFQDETLARLGSNTLFSFERGTRMLDLENGTILLQVPKDAGGATIRSAPVTAAITGTTLMMEYSPGKPGTVKLIVLEGTVRISLAGRLGESVLVGAGQMITVAADARKLGNPVTVDIRRILRTSRLIKEGELASMGLIAETVNAQQSQLQRGRLTQGGAFVLGQQTGNPALMAAGALNAQNLARNTVPLPPTAAPATLPVTVPVATPPPVIVVPTPPPTPIPTPVPQPSPYYNGGGTLNGI